MLCSQTTVCAKWKSCSRVRIYIIIPIAQHSAEEQVVRPEELNYVATIIIIKYFLYIFFSS